MFHYLLIAVRDRNGTYVLNGNYIISVSHKEIAVYGGVLDYSGSNSIIERISSSKQFTKDLEIMVCLLD